MSLKRTISDSSNTSSPSFGHHSSSSSSVYPSSSSKSSGGSTSLNSDENSAEKFLFKRPPQTQVHTSSSSASIPSEPHTISKAVDFYKPQCSEFEITGSQDLFTTEKKDEKLVHSTPLVDKIEGDLKTQGNNMSNLSDNPATELSYLHAKSNSQLSISSPTGPQKITFTSSSSEDEHKKRQQEQDSLQASAKNITFSSSSSEDERKKTVDQDSMPPDSLQLPTWGVSQEVVEHSEDIPNVALRAFSGDDSPVLRKPDNLSQAFNSSEESLTKYDQESQKPSQSQLQNLQFELAQDFGTQFDLDQASQEFNPAVESQGTSRLASGEETAASKEQKSIKDTEDCDVIPQTQLNDDVSNDVPNGEPTANNIESAAVTVKTKDNVDFVQKVKSAMNRFFQHESEPHKMDEKAPGILMCKKFLDFITKEEACYDADADVNTVTGNEPIDESKDIIVRNILYTDKLKINSIVFGEWDDTTYYPGRIKKMDSSKDRDNDEDETSIIFDVKLLQESSSKSVSISDICLLKTSEDIPGPSQITNQRDKRKRSSSSASSTISEKFPKKKKQRRVAIENVLLFTNFYFIVTIEKTYMKESGSTEGSPELNSEDELDLCGADIVAQILENGGRVITSINQREIDIAKSNGEALLCIANRPLQTVKYLYCVVTGIPIVHYQFIFRSIAMKTREKIESFTLPAGHHITGQSIEQDLNPGRDVYTPLSPWKIYFHISKKEYGRELNLLLQLVGCNRMFETYFVTSKTKKIYFNLSDVDIVCTLMDRVPTLLYNEVKALDKPILTKKWFVQCLLLNQFIDFHDSPQFQYEHVKSRSSSQNTNENVPVS